MTVSHEYSAGGEVTYRKSSENYSTLEKGQF